MKFITPALLASALLLASCAPMRPTMKELPVPPQRSVHRGFSLIPPDEKGWLIAVQEPETLVLGKQGSDPDENFIVRAYTVGLPEFKSQDEFMGFAKTALSIGDPVRHKLLSEETKAVTVEGQMCGWTKKVMEDHGAAKRSKRTDSMIIEVYSLVCPHPQKKMAVVVAYSHRYYPSNADPQSVNKADKIFETVEFVDF